MRSGRSAADESAPTRVLMVTPRFPPYLGGVEVHTFEVARRLAANPRFEVGVLTTDPDGGLPRSELVEGIRVERVGAWPPNADLYWSVAIQRSVLRADVDLIHVQGYHTLVPPLAMLAARRARLPYVLTFHSGGHSSRLRQVLRPIQVRFLRPLLRGAERLVAVSPFERALFGTRLGLGTRRIALIPNGADMPVGSDAGLLEREPGLLLSVGRLERYKGHHRVIDAMPHVRARVPDARLMILGSGPDEHALRARARDLGVDDAVEIRSLPHDQLLPVLRRAQVVALLSDYESQGIAAHEALALGARLVVNDATALAEIGHLPQAMAVPPDATAEVVGEALLAQLAAGLVPSAAIPELPTWDGCAAKLAHLYTDVIRRGRSGVTR